jgi:HK97 family phage major capsid protein
MKTDGVYRAACAMPWAIQPEKLDAIFDVLEFHAAGVRLSREEITARVGQTAGPRSSSAQGSVAVLPLFGVISQRMNMMSDVSGGTSTEKFGAELDALVANPQVSAIVLDVDSPGGSTAGVPELAAKIRAARDIKPIYALANGTMASAAYWLASQATEVIATPSAFVGSIGVLMVHTDDTQADAQAGLTRTVISAGKFKAEGFGALSDDAKANAQEIVDKFYGMFTADVAKGRGESVATVRNGYGEGRALLASDALASGLIDRIATMDDLLSELTTKPAGRVRANTRTLNLAAVDDQHRLNNLDKFAGFPDLAAIADPPPLTESQLDRIRAAVTGGFLVPVTQTGTLASASAPALVLHPTTAAPKAKENTVPDNNTVAQTGAATDAALAEMQAKVARADRSERIDELCSLVGATAHEAMEFKASDKTLVQIRTELQGRVGSPTPIAGAANLSVSNMRDREAEKPFASLGEQLAAIATYGTRGAVDKRLLHVQAAASGGSANVPSDGSFLIQQDFAVDLLKESMGEGQLASRCSTTEVSANSDGLEVAYIDETSRATGSRWGGIQIYRGAEADSATGKKPKIGKWELRLEDLIGAAYMTERLLQDAGAMQSVFEEGFRSEFAFVLDDEIIRGNGAAQCLGIINAGVTVSQAKETGQLADTVVAENVINMWSRLLPRSQANAAWFINQELTPQLQSMQIGTGASGQLVYMPPGGLSASPFGSIFGRPVVVVEQCSAKGDVGDIILADLSQYKIITKGGIQGDNSIHVRFLNNERTFRWVARVNGAPKLKTAVTPYKGANTLSPFVTLAAR